MSEEVATMQETWEVSGGVDQSSYVNDAWNDTYFNSHEAELNPDKAQTPKEEAQEETEEEKPKEEVKEEVKQPVNQESQLSVFEQAFSGENGAFDVDGFVGFNVPEVDTNAEPLDIGEPIQPIAEKEQWEKDREEISSMETNFQKVTLDPLDKAYQLISEGVDPVQALKQVYDEQRQFIQDKLNQIKSEKEFQRQKALEDRLLESTKAEKINQQVQINTNEIISSLPGKDTAQKTALFNEVLFGKDVGAKILDREFKRAYPNNEKMTPEQRSVAAQKFVNSILSDKAELRFVFDSCLNALKVKNMPKAMQADRLRAIEEYKQNRLSVQKAPVGTTQRIPKAVSKSQWDGYFSSHFEAADRI